MNEEKIMTTTLEQLSDYEFKVTFDRPEGVSLVVDEPSPLGKDQGPNAAQLLSTAIGNCLSASLLFCLRKVRIEPGKIETTIKTSFTRNSKDLKRIGKVHVLIEPHLPNSDQAGYARCLKLFEDYCVVTQSVRAGVPVEVEVIPSSS
jgi:organic hydroperoxide reductase OsmC/OhrA